jgi:hypothetical protein
MNSSIHKLILGKSEQDAIAALNNFKCIWRVRMRDGQEVSGLAPDRNDKRYNLIIRDGKVERVLFG